MNNEPFVVTALVVLQLHVIECGPEAAMSAATEMLETVAAMIEEGLSEDVVVMEAVPKYAERLGSDDEQLELLI